MKNNIIKKAGVVGISLIFITSFFISSVDSQLISINTIKLIEKQLIEKQLNSENIINILNAPFADIWEVTLEFNEPGGAYDNAFLGEKTDASDGQDSYDVPKPGGYMPPYIRAWFATDFSSPYDALLKEYKHYPDTYKDWNLTIQWCPSDYSSPTTLTISWNNDPLINDSEYSSVFLYDVGSSTNVADMLVNTSYSFTCPALTLQNFKIICTINQAPVANDDSDTVNEDSINNQIDVLANDNDPDGDNITIISVSDPPNGTATTDGNYTYYTPDPNYYGSDSYTYTINDDLGESDTAMVNITVTNINDPPNANDDTATVIEDSSTNQIDVLLNDIDVDGDTLNITSATQPSNGTTTYDANYVYYTPDPDYNGQDTFTYTIDDGEGETDTATVNITITPINDPPIANDDTATVIEDSNNNQINVKTNDNDPDGDNINITGVTQPPNGSVTFTIDYVLYTPNTNYNGQDTFTYTIDDGHTGTDTATVNVTVTGTNDPPNANDDTATITEDSSTNQIDVLLNDIDVDGDTLNITSITQPSNGTATYTVDYVFYTPNPNYNGQETFTYTIDDGHTGTDTATVNVTVTGTNDPPNANDDTATVIEDSSTNQIDVLLNDIDVDGDTLNITSATQPNNGTTTYDANYVYYTPNTDYTGPDTFTYTIDDGHTGTDTATVNITVTNLNDPPDAIDDYETVLEDSTNNQLDVLANDIDTDGDNLNITDITQPSFGIATYDSDYVNYTPNPDYSGSDQFSYTINDGEGGTDTATIYITVSGINDQPNANDDTATVEEDSNNNQINVLTNDNDPDGDTINITSVTQPPNGSVTFTINYVLYTPNTNYNGQDTFTYTIDDGHGGTDTAIVNVTITPLNDPPIANDDTTTVIEDSSNNQIDVLINDFDPDGDDVNIIGVTQPTHGSVTFTVDYVFYSPNPDYGGPDSFTYTISDTKTGTDTAIVNVTVTSINDPPNANDDIATVEEDSNNNQINVLTNDNDPDGDDINITSVTQPNNGTTTFDANYVYYTPDSNYYGQDTFNYTINDGEGGTDSATVNLTITPVNDIPNAIDDFVSVPEDSTNNQLDVLANDNDPDGDDLDIIAATQPLHGTTTYTTDYVFYTPTPDYTGSDQFSYTITDNNGGQSSAIIYVTVGAINDPPNANDDTTTVTEDTTDNQIDVLANDNDPDGDNLTILSVTSPIHGTSSTDGNYTYYSPTPNYNGDDSFTYTISDGIGGTDTAVVNITVIGTNDPPTANDDIATVIEDSINNQIDVLADDIDIDGDSLTIVSVTDPPNGTALTNSLYVFYTPYPDFSGPDQFNYSISDGNGGFDNATVYVTVTGTNDPPTANDDYETVNEDSVDNQIDVISNDVDPDGDDLDIISVSSPAHGTLAFTVSLIYYTPTPNYNGPDWFSYTISDGNGGSDSASVNVNVTAVNDPPVANDDTSTVIEDSVNNTIDVILNDIDIDGDNLTIISVSDPSYGSASTDSNYTYYTPNSNYNGDDSFTYTISDGNGGTAIATVSVTINPVNDPPNAVNDTVSVPEDSSNNQIDVILNDGDLDGDNLDVTGLTQPSNGTAIYTADYVYYTPNPDYSGSDQFNYSITDNNGGSDSATVFVTVGGSNDPPLANDDVATVLEDSVNNTIDVLVNDFDPDGDNLTIVSVTDPVYGSASTDGNYTYYSPNLNYYGIDSFMYTVIDGNGGSNIATVNLTVTGVNDPPVANDDYYNIFEDTTLNVPAPGVLLNDIDPDNDSLVAEKLSDPVHGILTFYSNGSFIFVPDENYIGTDNFTYRAYDGEFNSNTAIVNLTITSMNDSPIAYDDYYTTIEDTVLDVSAPGVLLNDTDEENDTLSAILVTEPSNGALTLNSNGSFLYSPDADYYGSDNFTYRASDGLTESNNATVYINITSVNDPSVALDDYYVIDEDTTLDVIAPGVLTNDIDPDYDSLTAEKLIDPIHGNLVFNSNGSFYYVPDANYVGYDSFTYWAYDGINYSNIATVHINITQINDPPIANDDTFEVEQDSVDNQFDVLFNDIDFDGDDLTIISVTMPEFGSVTFDGDYVYYTPNQYYIGSDQFEYNITDGKGGFDNAVVDITVRGVNHPPEKPLISGPPQGIPGLEYLYVFVSTDPEGDLIYYEILWGDGTFEDWLGPYSSDQAVSVSHSWPARGLYTITARAKDAHGAISEWGTLGVWMPRNKAVTNSFILRFLERLFYRFPLLSLLGLQFGIYSPKHLNISKSNSYGLVV